jgi:hypothetical protein
MSWTWNEELEATRDPSNCASCSYFKRSQHWAHLTAVDEFTTVFNDPSFLTGRPGSSLNKLTTFQVRQLLNEAGFQLKKFHRNTCANEAPIELVDAGFSPLELKTTTTQWLCTRGGPRPHANNRSTLRKAVASSSRA